MKGITFVLLVLLAFALALTSSIYVTTPAASGESVQMGASRADADHLLAVGIPAGNYASMGGTSNVSYLTDGHYLLDRLWLKPGNELSYEVSSPFSDYGIQVNSARLDVGIRSESGEPFELVFNGEKRATSGGFSAALPSGNNGIAFSIGADPEANATLILEGITVTFNYSGEAIRKTDIWRIISQPGDYADRLVLLYAHPGGHECPPGKMTLKPDDFSFSSMMIYDNTACMYSHAFPISGKIAYPQLHDYYSAGNETMVFIARVRLSSDNIAYLSSA